MFFLSTVLTKRLAFANYKSLLSSRLQNAADIFGNKKWMVATDADQKLGVYQKYNEYLQALIPNWNSEDVSRLEERLLTD